MPDLCGIIPQINNDVHNLSLCLQSILDGDGRAENGCSVSTAHTIGHSIPTCEHVIIVKNGFWSDPTEHHMAHQVIETSQPSQSNVENNISLSSNPSSHGLIAAGGANTPTAGPAEPPPPAPAVTAPAAPAAGGDGASDAWLLDDPPGPEVAREMGQLMAGLAVGGILATSIAAYAVYAGRPLRNSPSAAREEAAAAAAAASAAGPE